MVAINESTVRIVGIAILKGAAISAGMAVAAYVFLELFSGITDSMRLIVSLVFLTFGLIATVIVGVNTFLSRKSL